MIAQGTRAFQSVQMLRGGQYAQDGERLVHDYFDDLESFYWCLCWICFGYDGPRKPTDNTLPQQWQQGSPMAAANAKASHLLDEWDPACVRPYFGKDIDALLRCLHALFRGSYQVKEQLIKSKSVHTRTLDVIRVEAERTYEYVLGVIQRTIDNLGPEDEVVELPIRAVAPNPMIPLPPDTIPTTNTQRVTATPRKLGPTTTSSSFTNKRKASEASDEEPEQNKQADTAAFMPSNLRHSESIEP
ncbi:hypothetical protein HDZ31DRAFT_65913 [Schizophyllum fasciatum]